MGAGAEPTATDPAFLQDGAGADIDPDDNLDEAGGDGEGDEEYSEEFYEDDFEDDMSGS